MLLEKTFPLKRHTEETAELEVKIPLNNQLQNCQIKSKLDTILLNLKKASLKKIMRKF